MKMLALDIGEKRVGIASGDTDAGIAMPVSVLSTSDVLSNSRGFQHLIQEQEPELLLAGLPLSLSGQENSQAETVRKFAENIAEMLNLPLVYQDERLSSVEAKRYFREAGYTERQMRGRIDMLAASLTLQAYLDSQQLNGLETPKGEYFPQ